MRAACTLLSLTLLASCLLDRSGTATLDAQPSGAGATATAGGGSPEPGAGGGASAASGGDATVSSTATASSSGGATMGAGGTAPGAGGAGGGAPPPNPTWTVVETLTVPASGASVTSTTVLALGTTYRLRASGTYVTNAAQGWEGDAEYYDFSAQNDAVATVDVGIAVDDATVDLNRTPKWGPYAPSHVYEVDFAGMGATATVQLHDGNYGNNSGSLTLEILELM